MTGSVWITRSNLVKQLNCEIDEIKVRYFFIKFINLNKILISSFNLLKKIFDLVPKVPHTDAKASESSFFKERNRIH
jgi:hypothetical protein